MKTPTELVSTAKSQVKTCSPLEAALRLEADDSVILVDVRETSEYRDASIASSINIPRGLLEWKISEACPDASQSILIHCASGGRATLSVKSLVDMGYKNVTAVDGSFVEIVDAISVRDKARQE